MQICVSTLIDMYQGRRFKSLYPHICCIKSLNFLFIHIKTCCNSQDNEPLMRALSKLINLNSPDLVLFVGEALVGNDAVDQLSKFNQVLFLYTCGFFFVSLPINSIDFQLALIFTLSGSCHCRN